jgi:hypothetical protein
MKLKNKTYDILKWILLKVVPALIILIGTLGKIYDFETIANTINLTIGAVALFFSSILGISSKNYYKNKGE